MTPVTQTFAGPKVELARIKPPRVESRLAPPAVVNPDTFTPCAFVTDNFNRADENPIGGIWGPMAAFPADQRGNLTSNAFAKNVSGVGTSKLNQPINLLAPWQMSVTLLNRDPIGIMLMGARDDLSPNTSRAIVQISTVSGGDLITLSMTGATTVTLVNSKPQSGDQFALVWTPLGGTTSRLSLRRKAPGASDFQTIAECVSTTWDYAANAVVIPSLYVSNGLTLDDFSFCPYTNDGVTPALSRSVRGTPKSRLDPPAVVTPAATQIFFGPKETLARIRPQRTHSFLRSPVVVNAFVADAVADVTLAYQSRGKPKSRLRPMGGPAVVYAPVEVKLAYSRRGTPKSRLEPPTVIDLTPQTRFLTVHLAYSRRGTPKSRLEPPTVVAAFIARPTDTTLTRITPPRTHSFIRSPVVVNANVADGVVEVALAYSRRGAPKSVLRQPIGAAPAPVDAVADVTLTYSSRGKPKSRLSLTAIIDLRPQVFFISTTLARIKPPPVHSILRKPTDLVDAQDVGFVRTHLAYSLRGKAKSKLRPPVVIDLRPQTFFVSTTLVQIRPQPTTTRLFPPTDLIDNQDLGFVSVTLAPQKRGIPKSILHPPTDTKGLEDQGRVAVHLAYSRRGRPLSTLRRPVVVGPVLARPIRVELARIRPVKTLAILRQPVVVTPRVPQDATLDITLAYSVRGKPKSRLEPPTVVGPVLARAIVTKLVRIRPVRTLAILRRPTDLVDAQDLGAVRVTLAYSLRGKAKPHLSPPAVVAPVLAPPIVTPFVQIRPPRTHPFLRAPVVVGSGPLARTILVSLAPSSRGTAKPHLSPPATIVVVVPLARPTAVHLAPPSRGKPKSKLSAPVVVQAFRIPVVFVALAPSSRGLPKSRLFPPTDLIDRQDLGQIAVALAYSSRGRPMSKLRQPTVVAPVLALPITTTLAPQKRGVPKSRLSPPTVVTPRVEDAVADITLVKIRPAAVHSILRKPAVVGAGIYFRGILVSLAPPSRGKPKSKLSPASPFAPTPKAELVLAVTLAYSSRGKPKSILRKPAFIDVRPQTRFLSVNLTPGVRGKPMSILRPPTVVVRLAVRPVVVTLTKTRPRPTTHWLRQPVAVNAFVADAVADITLVRIRPSVVHSILREPTVVGVRDVFRGLLVSLAPSRRGTAKPFRLGPPTSIVTPAARPVLVQLAYSRRGKPLSGLGRPVVLNANTAYPQGPMVQLAPQKRGTPKSRLQPPAVVLSGKAFFGPNVTLVRIRPARTRWLLRQPVVVDIECFGDVVGFDFAPEVCGTDEGATVTGTTSSTNAVSGSDAAATVEGASAAGGSVTGGDAKREGC